MKNSISNFLPVGVAAIALAFSITSTSTAQQLTLRESTARHGYIPMGGYQPDDEIPEGGPNFVGPRYVPPKIAEPDSMSLSGTTTGTSDSDIAGPVLDAPILDGHGTQFHSMQNHSMQNHTVANPKRNRLPMTDYAVTSYGTQCRPGFDCRTGGAAGRHPWKHASCVAFSQYGPGEYAGPPREAQMSEYRLRAGDELQFTYMVSRELMNGTYRIGVGDEIMIHSLADEETINQGTLEKGIEVQQDGTISLRILGRVHAVGMSFEQLRVLLEEKYEEHYKKPGIDVTPVRTNMIVEDIQNAIGGVAGFNEQSINRTVAPDGMITLPMIGQFSVQGLTVLQIRDEVNLRYQVLATGLEIEVSLSQQAPHFVAVLGEVRQPGRYEMQGPTSAITAIALAGGRNPGGNLRQVVVFRRADDWRLLSTVLDLRKAILGKNPLPRDEIWLRDGDVVIVPTSPIQQFDNFVSLVFTQGIYGVVPFSGFDLVEAINGFEVDNNR